MGGGRVPITGTSIALGLWVHFPRLRYFWWALFLIIALARLNVWHKHSLDGEKLCAHIEGKDKRIRVEGQVRARDGTIKWGSHRLKVLGKTQLAGAVRIRGVLKCRRPYQNPSGSVGRWVRLEVPQFQIQASSVFPLPQKQRFKSDFRNWLLGRVQGKWRALVRAVWLADLGGLEPQVIEAFRSMGMAHLLAVSGQHVLIVCVGIFLLLGAVGRLLVLTKGSPAVFELACIRRYVPLVISIAFLWSTDQSPSTLRVSCLVGCLFFVRAVGLYIEPITCLWKVALILIVWDPVQLTSIGFILSVVATVYVLSLGQTTHGLSQYFWISFWMPILMMPLTLYFFGAYFWLAPLTGVLLNALWSLIVLPVAYLLPLLGWVANRELAQQVLDAVWLLGIGYPGDWGQLAGAAQLRWVQLTLVEMWAWCVAVSLGIYWISRRVFRVTE